MMQQNSLSQKNSLRTYIGSSVLFIFIILSVPTFGPMILSTFFFPLSVRYKVANLWVASVIWLTKILCGLTYQVEGLDNLPKDQGFIVLSKHQSAWETLALRLFLPMQTTVLKRSLTQIPIGGWALSILKPIVIDRDKPRQALNTIIKQGTERLKEGLVVVIFPEGTRAAPGENKKFNAGGALLAHHSGYPVIPLAHNAGEFWPRYSFLKYPGTIKVKIGPAIEAKGKKAKEINSEAEAWIAQAMKKISPNL
ncbi:MAG: 1-acyl-sn-glycerol-3-phosphate acyltransferase [Methylococcales bacterium]|nr:1-acyl-sn-glycerol-3-phosphate acyltransferase [Methylococcales bacterium]MCK5478472.1 1-acyl-sn-glycerol-3-phosphate acyltransferase [Methylococcales bacterium]